MSRQRSALAMHKRIYNNCCPVVSSCSPGTITGLTINDSGGTTIIVSWNPLPGATSYSVTATSPPGFPATITRGSLTSATIAYDEYDLEETVTVTAITACGNTSSSVQVNPCFLAGSLVHMADGSTKAIEDVRVNDLVIGAFGEINRVLALHRPVLGSIAQMCKINDEHSTTNHHPHISVDKQFYCGDPELVSTTTYGRKHNVIDEFGNTVERMLHGLAKGRIRKLETGVELKTIEGSRIAKTIELYSMPETTQLYNLVIDGSHTYHVDGYAVTGWPSEHDFDYDSWSRK
jgi:hypothetical protein